MVTEKHEPVPPERLEEVRGNLLAYYTSQITAHGNYIIALFIGFITLVSVFNSLPVSVAYVLASGLFGLLVCISGRTLFYGYLTVIIMRVDPELEIFRGTSVMDKLHLDASATIQALAHSKAPEVSRRSRYWYRIANSFATSKFEILILSSLISLGFLLLATLILRVHGFIL